MIHCGSSHGNYEHLFEKLSNIILFWSKQLWYIFGMIFWLESIETASAGEMIFEYFDDLFCDAEDRIHFMINHHFAGQI